MSKRRVVVKQAKPQGGGGMQAAMREMANIEGGMPMPYVPPNKETTYLHPAGPSPTAEDMSEVLKHLQLWHVLQPYKGYPREPYVLGRVKVRLTDEDGIPWNPDVPDRKTLMRKMAEMAPQLKTRHERLRKEKEDKERKEREERERQQAAAAAAAASGTKRKGKKKGKR